MNLALRFRGRQRFNRRNLSLVFSELCRKFFANTPRKQCGDSVPPQNSGTFVAPLFINSGSSAALDSRGICSVNTALDGSNSNELASQLPSVPSQNCSPESAFVLGPGRAPIPAKMVKRILQHEFVEMSELMPENLEEPQAQSPVFTLVGSLVVPKPNSAKKNTVTDFSNRVECFNSYH